MRLDIEGYAGLLAFLQSHGYAGTLDQWLEEMARQAHGANIRRFEAVSQTALEAEFPLAHKFVCQVLALAKGRFDGVRVRDDHRELSIDFSRVAARRQDCRVGPLKIDGLALDMEFLDKMVRIRCRLYVNTENRRDRDFTFLLQTPALASKGRK